MARILSLGEENLLPTPPAEVEDAVKVWARGNGRSARMKFIPMAQPPCWSVNLSLKPDDPALRRWQEGKADHEPTEGVLLIEWDATVGKENPITGRPFGAYRAVNLEEYGPTGVVELLEKGNTWSGRGDFNSLQEAVIHAASKYREEKEKIKQRQREFAKDYGRDIRRQLHKIPFLRVGIDLKPEAEKIDA